MTVKIINGRLLTGKRGMIKHKVAYVCLAPNQSIQLINGTMYLRRSEREDQTQPHVFEGPIHAGWANITHTILPDELKDVPFIGVIIATPNGFHEGHIDWVRPTDQPIPKIPALPPPEAP